MPFYLTVGATSHLYLEEAMYGRRVFLNCCVFIEQMELLSELYGAKLLKVHSHQPCLNLFNQTSFP